MSADIPEWAKQRAADEINRLVGPVDEWRAFDVARRLQPTDALEASQAFALYIAEHEDEPVDPLLIEAREVCAKAYESLTHSSHIPAAYRAGEYDSELNNANLDLPIALAGIKRGIELAKAGDA